MNRDSFSFAPAHLVSAMDLGMAEAERAAALLQTADDAVYSGRFVNFDGVDLHNFGCCSYLGLELRPELKAGAIAAIERFGTQFPFPRAMLQSPLYVELEALLRQITGGHVVIAASTSLGHISALPVLIEPQDAVIIDHFAHASLHTAVALLRGITIETLRHSRLNALEARLKELSAKHRRVWYVLDGLYSMLGDFAPIQELQELLGKYPALHLYVDDAHSTSWTGRHGRGWALEHLHDRSRVVVALSLNKAFSAGGAALVFANEVDANRVRRAGGPMVFSGALQPPLLGAAVASAKLHLSDELAGLQRELAARLELVVSLASEFGVPIADETPTPVFFVRCRTADKTFALVNALRKRRICVCAAMFPIVPQNKAGIRFTISLHNTPDDIEYLMNCLALEVEYTARHVKSGTVRIPDDVRRSSEPEEGDRDSVPA